MKPIFLDWREARMDNLKRTIPVPESRTERASHTVYGAAGDFNLAIADARTAYEAELVAAMLEPLISVLTSTAQKALRKAEDLK